MPTGSTLAIEMKTKSKTNISHRNQSHAVTDPMLWAISKAAGTGLNDVDAYACTVWYLFTVD